jgi:hypothetical protein
MVDTFGAKLLEDLHKQCIDNCVQGCPEFTQEEINSIQTIVDVRSHLEFFVYLTEMINFVFNVHL